MCAGMDQPQPTLDLDSAAVESRSPSSQDQPGRLCSFDECYPTTLGIPADTPCSIPGCRNWCHYEECYARFCDASEFYPGLDTNPLREGLMVAFCQPCAYVQRAEYREFQDIHDTWMREQYHSDSDTTQDYDPGDDSQVTQDIDSDDIVDTVAPQA